MAKTFSGKQVIKILIKHFGFAEVSRKGSHVKLEKIVQGTTYTTIVPDHKEIQTGTLHGVLELAQVEKKDFLQCAKR